MKLTLVDVEAILRSNERVDNMMRQASNLQSTTLVRVVQEMMIQHTRMEMELAKIQHLGPEELHVHRASCDDASGNHMCGF
jgi:predicted nucleotidyltransferase